MDNLNTALMLMVVGMVTVFLILLIVIGLGKTLIALVNKYAPAEVVPSNNRAKHAPAPIPAHIMAVISAAVTVATNRKGRVAKVERKSK